MPRTARLVIPGYPFHITHRGNNKQAIFNTDEDRRRYLYYFNDISQKYGMRILAYCLMNNHVHFIAMADHNLSFAKTINSAHMRYAQYFNHRYGKIGHLWQGRYYSCILDQAHLLAAIRYVERNPVRSGITQQAWDWSWSSAREHLKLEKGIINLENVYLFVEIPSWHEYLCAVENQDDLNEIRKETFSLKAWAEESFKDFIETQYHIQLKPKPMGRPWPRKAKI